MARIRLKGLHLYLRWFCVVFSLKLTFSVCLQMATTSSRFASELPHVQQKENSFYLRVLKEVHPGILSFSPGWPNLGNMLITRSWEGETLIVQA